MDNESKKQEMFEKMKERKREVKVVRKIVSIVALVCFAIIAIGGFATYSYIKSALEPLDPEATEEIAVDIPMGSGVTSISQILEDNGIIKSAQVFKYYAKFKNESQFQAGAYNLTKSMTLDEIIESLKTGKVYREPVFAITVPEGLTLEQIADIVAEKTSYTAEDFMAKVTDQTFINSMMSQYPNLLTEAILGDNIRYALEGYLYPATYHFMRKNHPLMPLLGK